VHACVRGIFHPLWKLEAFVETDDDTHLSLSPSPAITNSNKLQDAVLTHVYKIDIPPAVSDAVAEAEKMEAELARIRSALLGYANDKTTMKLRLGNYNARLLTRWGGAEWLDEMKCSCHP
jgi:hypothetical protein